MPIYNEYDLNNFLKAYPEFAEETKELVSLDFLHSGNYYTSGIRGITKAHFMTPNGKMYCNPIQALIILSKAYALDRTEKMLGSAHTPKEVKEEFVRKYDIIKKQLWPRNNGAPLIKDPFYKRLFGYVVTHDTFRNVENSKINKAVFDMEIISHFQCINPIGAQYTEEEIRLINQELYKEAVAVRDPEKKGLADIALCLVEEDVSTTLAAEYGWEFTYREYVLSFIDWDIIAQIEAAFPRVAEAVRQAADLAFVETDDSYQYNADVAAQVALVNQQSNPIAQTVPYKRLQENNYERMLALIGYKNPLDMPLEEYLIQLAHEFVIKVEQQRRHSNFDPNKIREVAEQIADHIYARISEHN